MVRRDDDLAILRVLFIPIRILLGAAEYPAGVRLWRKEITERIRVRTRGALMNFVGLTQGHIVDEYLLVDNFQSVSR